MCVVNQEKSKNGKSKFEECIEEQRWSEEACSEELTYSVYRFNFRL